MDNHDVIDLKYIRSDRELLKFLANHETPGEAWDTITNIHVLFWVHRNMPLRERELMKAAVLCLFQTFLLVKNKHARDAMEQMMELTHDPKYPVNSEFINEIKKLASKFNRSRNSTTTHEKLFMEALMIILKGMDHGRRHLIHVFPVIETINETKPGWLETRSCLEIMKEGLKPGFIKYWDEIKKYKMV
jgi:hypothetical protein